MKFHISKHAAKELARRNIPIALVEAVLADPEQKVPEHGTIICYQSRMAMGGKDYPLRVMVSETSRPRVVVTAYRTGKIEKYWSES
jgi:hypothetical protein